MEEIERFEVIITHSAQQYFYELAEHLYTRFSPTSVTKIVEQLRTKTNALVVMPERGQKEPLLKALDKNHRYLLSRYGSRKTIKIIYYVDQINREVYLTDYFPSEMKPEKMVERNS